MCIYNLFVLLQIYPDPESEKAIMGSVVYCIHHKEGCQWSDELRKLKVGNFVLKFFFITNTKYCFGTKTRAPMIYCVPSIVHIFFIKYVDQSGFRNPIVCRAND